LGFGHTIGVCAAGVREDITENSSCVAFVSVIWHWQAKYLE
jgi:hypothetical protein